MNSLTIRKSCSWNGVEDCNKSCWKIEKPGNIPLNIESLCKRMRTSVENLTLSDVWENYLNGNMSIWVHNWKLVDKEYLAPSFEISLEDFIKMFWLWEHSFVELTQWLDFDEGKLKAEEALSKGNTLKKINIFQESAKSIDSIDSNTPLIGKKFLLKSANHIFFWQFTRKSSLKKPWSETMCIEWRLMAYKYGENYFPELTGIDVIEILLPFKKGDENYIIINTNFIKKAIKVKIEEAYIK